MLNSSVSMHLQMKSPGWIFSKFCQSTGIDRYYLPLLMLKFLNYSSWAQNCDFFEITIRIQGLTPYRRRMTPKIGKQGRRLQSYLKYSFNNILNVILRSRYRALDLKFNKKWIHNNDFGGNFLPSTTLLFMLNLID